MLLREQSSEVDRKRKLADEVRLENLGRKKAVWQVKDAIWREGRAPHIQMRVRAPEPPPRPLGWNEDPPPRADEVRVWRNGAYYRRGYAPIEEAREVVGAERNARLGATYLSAMRTAQVTSAFNVRYGGVFVNTL
jgi:hypothetical protein